MSEPSNKSSPARTPESVPYATVTFHYTMSDGTPATLKSNDCLRNATIDGLKEQFVTTLGPADSQNWYYGRRLMANTKTFEDYGIDFTEDVDIEVRPSNN
ncbi:unnamed protein product [Candidula unifasciata]|uniref:Ubiquitin-like domain-containing protein n=1 Tax=Candidula unifasciata TaxID=100452 RepID=A0A8S3YN03_9EUPU|nr:unnamed protein product [Candidula unifasciata]